jgi:hypothetical protein
MKLKIVIAVISVSILALIALSQIKRKPFAPAEDFPREALVYAQIADLPAFIRLWNESNFKEKYLESENFQDFKNRHLGLKLASRWQEFSDATGFPIDFEVLSGLTKTSATLAVYDIGKLDFVFIAPVSDEVFAATKFVQNQDKFQAETLNDETTIYRAKVEADRGRQKQELIFTHAKGRFILTTSEKLLTQTLANINAKVGKNSLADELSFKILSEKIEPRVAAVWVNQTALNEDYYFKRYWLMPDAERLKNIRAGIFDFSMEEGKLIERRKFLLTGNADFPVIKSAEKSLAYLHPNIPFYRLQAASDQTVDVAVQDTLFERTEISPETKSQKRYRYSSFNYSDDFSSSDYYHLSENFDETIDHVEEKMLVNTNQTEIKFADFLKVAAPQSVLTFTEPKIAPAPLFVEFRRATIFNLKLPAAFNREAFELAIEKKFSAQMMISAPDAQLKWETKSENDRVWREINLPMTGWKASYAIRDNELILTNNSDFLHEIISAHNLRRNEKTSFPATELTVLNLEQRETAYDRVFDELARKKAVYDFFTGNIKSLLDSISDVKKIEVRKNYSHNFLDEEIILHLQ